MRAFLVLILALLSGCCTAKQYEDMRERAETAEKALQAKREAELRESCDV